MTIDPLTASLLAAIGALSTAIVSLWRRVESLHSARSDDQRRASRIIFALLQARRDARGEPSPPTLTEWDEEPTTAVTQRAFDEAQVHAKVELNGDTEALVRRYLSNTPSEAPIQGVPAIETSKRKE